MPTRTTVLLLVAGMLALRTESALAGIEERSQVLSLVSLEYRLDGQDHVRTHDLLAYLPFVSSGDPGVMELAALSVTWEKFALVPHKAFEEQITAIEGLAGGLKILPRSVKDNERLQNLEEAQKQAEERMKGPLQRAIQKGALAAFEKNNVLAEAQRGFDEGLKEGMTNVVDKQAKYWIAQSLLRRMQDVLWDRAEALARSSAGHGGPASDLAVLVRTERRRGYVIVAQNRSARDLHHVTLAAVVTRRPLNAPGTGGDMVLGGMLAGMIGEDDASKGAKTTATFMGSAAAYKDVMNRPSRVILHVPVLPAGKELSTVLIRSTIDLGRSEAGTCSAWCDELSFERAKIGELDRLLEESHKRIEEAAKQRLEQAKGRRARSGLPGLSRPSAPPRSTNPRRSSPGLGPLTGPRPSPGRAPNPRNRVGRGDASSSGPGQSSPAETAKAEAMLRQARSTADTNPISAAGTFRRVFSLYAGTPSAEEAKSWLKDYPKLLLERADELEPNDRTELEAVRFYREVLKSSASTPEAKTARAKLDALASRLSDHASDLEKSGDRLAARAVYLRLVRNVPESAEAARARERLRQLTPGR